jgi:hypothetical protein
VEPSAGDGAFVRPLLARGEQVKAFDIDPRHPKVRLRDFLKEGMPEVQGAVVVGNPPFGKRAKLAVSFFNIAAESARVIAFVVPVQFQKWSVQSKLNFDFALVSETKLPEDAFLVDGRPYSVRCVFQVWVRRVDAAKDLRLKSKPVTTHRDFQTFQYNNTPAAMKVFRNSFDFAVPRQGYQDYSRRETTAKACEKTKQWLLFKARDAKVLARLRRMDFDALSKRNTTVPGFGKADVVLCYTGAI